MPDLPTAEITNDAISIFTGFQTIGKSLENIIQSLILAVSPVAIDPQILTLLSIVFLIGLTVAILRVIIKHTGYAVVIGVAVGILLFFFPLPLPA